MGTKNKTFGELKVGDKLYLLDRFCFIIDEFTILDISETNKEDLNIPLWDDREFLTLHIQGADERKDEFKEVVCASHSSIPFSRYPEWVGFGWGNMCSCKEEVVNVCKHCISMATNVIDSFPK